ncbi:TonB-dependent receptor plug domain-containing protein [Novosphingobium sp. 9]|uniref:TonB-dependent receptor plug domain-containing protein n=1 Tax=Novosphingobium sp. 9 TaxID=2025349 RepID=UPI0021B63CDF|nr:TonB-dependent receptor [Novosphingobium sp. 9]
MLTHTRMLRAFLLASAGLVPLAAHAQDAQPAGQQVDLHFTVTRDGGPATIATQPLNGTTQDRRDFARKAADTSDTAKLLSDFPGVAVNTGGGFSSMPRIRGLSEQRIRIVIDGVTIDMACPNDMNTPLSYTDPQTIASIAVVPGVAPVSMGGDNIGGVISVDSVGPRFNGRGGVQLSGEASTFYRSNGDGFGGALSLTAAGKNVSLTYTGSYTKSGNYNGGGDLGTVHSSEYEKTDQALALAVNSDAGLFQLKVGYHHSPYEGFVNQWMDMTNNTSWYLNGRWRKTFDWGDLDWTGNWRDTRHAMNFLSDKQPGDMPMRTNVHTLDTALKATLPMGGQDKLRLGVEAHHQWLNDFWPPVPGDTTMMGPDTFVNVNGAHRDRIGAFAEVEKHWSDTLSTLVGLRYDRVEMNTGDVQGYGDGMMQAADAAAAAAFNAADHRKVDHNWSGSAMFSWAASSLLTVELGYAHKTRSPNIYERYTWGQGAMSSQMVGWYGDGNGYYGNLNLKPERADTVSAAVRLAGQLSGERDWSVKVSPYYTHVNDYIDARKVADLSNGFAQLQFDNEQAEFYGIDGTASVTLAKGQDSETNLDLTASWVHGENLSDDTPLYHQMPFNAKLALSHRQGALEAGADLTWVTQKTRVDTARNEPETGGYALVGLDVAYTIAGVRFSVSAENLLDKAYYLPLGGISLGDYDATGVLRAVPGMGRSVNFGLSTSF